MCESALAKLKATESVRPKKMKKKYIATDLWW